MTIFSSYPMAGGLAMPSMVIPKVKQFFEFHGNPSSRLGSILFDEAAKKMGIRVIGIDRPGMVLKTNIF